MRGKVFIFAFLFFVSSDASAFSIPENLNHYSATDKQIDHDREAWNDTGKINYSGLVWLGNCSGFLVNMNSKQDSPSFVITNGHCAGLTDKPSDMILVDVRKKFWAKFLVNNMKNAVEFNGDHIEYATMKGTDIAVLRLSNTYGEISKEGIMGFKISPMGAQVDEKVIRADIHSMRLHRYKCSIEHKVHILKEDKWSWKGAYRDNCGSWEGSSGSPLISFKTGEVVGIHNTWQKNGGQCTLNNPCEMNEDGTISVFPTKTYSQRVKEIATCFNKKGEFDLYLKTCQLEKPGAEKK